MMREEAFEFDSTRQIYKYAWDYDLDGPVATFPTSDFFAPANLSIGDQINIITPDDLVVVFVVRIDGGVGPIVNESTRVSRV